jgi:hypothetical protein
MQKHEFELLTEIGSGTNSFQAPGTSDADLAVFQMKVEKLKSLEGHGYIEILDERKDIILLRITPEGQQILRDQSSPHSDK